MQVKQHDKSLWCDQQSGDPKVISPHMVYKYNEAAFAWSVKTVNGFFFGVWERLLSFDDSITCVLHLYAAFLASRKVIHQ